MQTVADRPEAPTAIRTDLGAIFVSLELSRSTWLITSLAPDGGEKMSKHVVGATSQPRNLIVTTYTITSLHRVIAAHRQNGR